MDRASRIGVTGASGFVGRAVLEALKGRGIEAVALTHSARAIESVESRHLGDVAALDAPAALEGLDAVIHLAARVHRMSETPAEAQAGHRSTNVVGTRKVAEMSARAGVRRMVLCSSVKAMAERDPVDANGRAQALTYDAVPSPEDAYGRSKLAAEGAMWSVCADGALEGVGVRPPLVHGAGVGGNLPLLMRAVAGGWPLPFAGIDNRRSLVSVRNLADLLVTCAGHPAAAGRIFLVADGPPVSTPALLRGIGAAMDRPPRLLPAPTALLALANRLDGRRRMARLTESLSVDDAHTRRTLGWRPPQTFEDGLAEMVEAWRSAGGYQTA